MHNSIVCSEDVPLYDDAKIDREALSRTYLGTAQVDALKALCQDWPRGPVDRGLPCAAREQRPALLLSGTADPVTPAAIRRRGREGLPQRQCT
jgi:hypothetical protein